MFICFTDSSQAKKGGLLPAIIRMIEQGGGIYGYRCKWKFFDFLVQRYCEKPTFQKFFP